MKTDYNAEISGIGFHFYRSIGKSKKGFEKLSLRWPEPIYMRVGYVFESRFSAGMINRFLRFLASFIKNGRTLRKCYFLVGIKTFEILAHV